MARLIVITPPHEIPNEPESIVALLQAGVHRVHLRKPSYNKEELGELLAAIPREWHSRLSLHDHFNLIDQYPACGVHLNKRNPHVPQGFDGVISRSCHSLEKVKEYKSICDYLFLSPIFDSVSKTDLHSGFTPNELNDARKDGIIDDKVYALGGITPQTITTALRHGFGGAAALGSVWEHFDTLNHPKAIPDTLLDLLNQLRIYNQGRLQFITQETEQYSHYDAAKIALEGGICWIQLRMKNQLAERIQEEAFKIKALCDLFKATFIIDDYPEIAREVQAHGVHLGKHDMSAEEARGLLGHRYIIGGTANTFDDIERHYLQKANYIGAGPFRFTTTKEQLSPLLGADGYKDLMQQCAAKNISIPTVAIGGITAEDIPGILTTGVDGVALSSTILQSSNPMKTTQKIIHFLKQAT